MTRLSFTITVRVYHFIYNSKNYYGFPIKTFGNDVSKASTIFYTINVSKNDGNDFDTLSMPSISLSPSAVNAATASAMQVL